MERRDFLKRAGAAGALMLINPLQGMALASGPSRTSKLFPGGGLLVQTDLHNHSIFSDGFGDPASAYSQMRASGLDVAAMTDHAIMGKDAGEICAHFPGEVGRRCRQAVGISQTSWARSGEYADAADGDGFVAMRGFEWSTGSIGHVNVWFTDDWTDANRTRALVTPRAAGEVRQVEPGLAPIFDAVQPAIDQTPELATMEGLYDWLRTEPSTPVIGGGAGGLLGFNHPNLYGDFRAFAFDPRVRQQVVACEALNGFDDYLLYDVEKGKPPPLNACLNAGWRVGLLGTTDEHDATYGMAGKARAGMWVNEVSRAGVKEAMLARRFFATFHPDLRLDASANAARMGSVLRHTSGDVTFSLDVDGGVGWDGRPLRAQLFRPGATSQVLVHEEEFASGSLVSFTQPVAIEDGDWAFIRIAEGGVSPTKPFGSAVAYASPFFFEPA